MDDKALDIVLASYREMFGVKTERGNELHRGACVEVAALRDLYAAIKETRHLGAFAVPAHVKAALELCDEQLASLERKP